MALLDVSKATPELQKMILEYAADVRKFEIDLFWRRSLFFWGFISVAFVAYGVLLKQTDKEFALAVSCFGLICSVAWTLQNRGSKYWQEAWEQKVETVEKEVLGAALFSNWEPVKKKGPWGAAKFSVSKLAIALSDFTVFIWLVLIWKVNPLQAQIVTVFTSSLGNALAVITLIYIAVLFIQGRTGDSP
jgi:hypothetical protein